MFRSKIYTLKENIWHLPVYGESVYSSKQYLVQLHKHSLISRLCELRTDQIHWADPSSVSLMMSQISMLRVQSSAWRLPSVAFSEERVQKMNWLEYLFNYWSNSAIKMCQLKSPPRNIQKAFDVLICLQPSICCRGDSNCAGCGCDAAVYSATKTYFQLHSIHPFNHVSATSRKWQDPKWEKLQHIPRSASSTHPNPHPSCPPALTSSRITVNAGGIRAEDK